MGIIGVGCAWIGFPGKDSLAVELFSQLYRFDNPFFSQLIGVFARITYFLKFIETTTGIVPK
jgi:hypothetical protein